AAAGALTRAGDTLQFQQVFVAHLPGGVSPDRLVNILNRHVAPLEVAGGDRTAVEDEAGDVESDERHGRAGQRLVAGGQDDDRVEHVPAADQLDRVRDYLPA